MKSFAAAVCLFLFALSGSSQTAEKILATANGQKFTASDLPAEIADEYRNFPSKLAVARRALLDEQIGVLLAENEARARGIPVGKLLELEVAEKVPAPEEEQIKQIFEANRNAIGSKTLAEMRPQIVEFLRREPEEKIYLDLVTNLKTKYKVLPGKDLNAPNLVKSDVLVSVGQNQITVLAYEARNRWKLADIEGEFYDRLLEELEQVMFSSLVSREAKSLDLKPAELIAREITDKLREFSDAEREQMQDSFQSKLFQKYGAEIFLAEPTPFVQQISTADNPSEGPADAPVTVVMFSDFQCPTCSAMHPVLKQVIAEYGKKVRIVVRDFPLVNLHQYAFRAALAANAANAQGKFTAFSELLYKNQEHLDDASLKSYAAALGLNIQQFELDLNNEKFADEIRKDIADGISYGVNGTPTIFVNGVKVRKLSAASFRKAIRESLNE